MKKLGAGKFENFSLHKNVLHLITFSVLKHDIINIVIKMTIAAMYLNHFLSSTKQEILAVAFILKIKFDNNTETHSWQIYSKSKAVKLAESDPIPLCDLFSKK